MSPRTAASRSPELFQLAFDESGKLVGFAKNAAAADVVIRYGDGTTVYLIRDCPKHACPPRKEDCHPDDTDFCRTRGHYGRS